MTSSVSVILNNFLTNGQILYVGQLLVTDSNIPGASYGTFSSSAAQIGNGMNMTFSVPAVNNTIFYFWPGSGTIPPSDDQDYQGALMLNGANGTINLINSTFVSVYGQSDNTLIWSIISSSSITINNQSGFTIPVGYNNIPSGSSLNPSLYPYPYGTLQSLLNGNSLNINLAYPMAPSDTVVKTNTIVALYTGTNNGRYPSYIGLFNNALATLIDVYSDNTLIVTRTSTNNYQITQAAPPNTGLQWWAWVLIIIGVLFGLFLIIYFFWAMSGRRQHEHKQKYKTTDPYYDPYHDPYYNQSIQPIRPVVSSTHPPAPAAGTILYPAGYVQV